VESLAYPAGVAQECVVPVQARCFEDVTGIVSLFRLASAEVHNASAQQRLASNVMGNVA